MKKKNKGDNFLTKIKKIYNAICSKDSEFLMSSRKRYQNQQEMKEEYTKDKDL